MTSWNLISRPLLTRLWLSLRLCISVLLYYSGILNLYRAWKRRRSPASISILAYHDVSDHSYLGLQVPEKVFEIHMRYLCESDYRIISLEEAVSMMSSGEEIPHDCVVITFDDGYRSMYTKVYPIVRRYNIPITIFISTEPVDREEPLYVDLIASALRDTPKKSLDLTAWGMGRYSLASPWSMEEACHEIIAKSKCLSPGRRREFMEHVLSELDVQGIRGGADRDVKGTTLNWDEIVEMSRHSVAFGSHTVTHPCLASISLEDARREIRESGLKIARKTGREVVAFAYPYGSANDVSVKVRDLVEQLGYRCACLLEKGTNRKGDDLFLLKRKNITTHIIAGRLTPFARSDFAVQLSGILERGAPKAPASAGPRDGKINILYMIDQLCGMAGTERHLLYLVSRLDSERFRCFVCCFKGDAGGMVGKIRERGIEVIDLDLERIYSPEAPLKALEIGRIIKKNKIDIVQTFHFKSDTFGVFTSYMYGVRKIISSRRDMGDLKSNRQRLLSKLMNRYINRYIMVCNRVGERFHRLEDVPMERMSTIYNGVDFDIFNLSSKSLRRRSDLGLRDDDFVVGSTAIFRPEKSYHVLFEAMERLLPKIKGLRAVVIGHGPLQKHFTEYCAKGPLRDVVKFVGRVDDVENYLPLLDVFCLVPTRNEGFSNAIIEAMAMGRVVVATDVGGNAEAVENGETGFLIPPDDPGALADRIMYLYENRETLRAMGEKARQRAQETFSVDAMINRHEEFYEDVYRLV